MLLNQKKERAAPLFSLPLRGSPPFVAVYGNMARWQKNKTIGHYFVDHIPLILASGKYKITAQNGESPAGNFVEFEVP